MSNQFDPMKYTPGPWQWADRNNDEVYNFDIPQSRLTTAAQHRYGLGLSLRTVAEYGRENCSFKLPEFICEAEEISRGNAQLLATAPELLEALKDCVEKLKEVGVHHELYETAEEVIAKAEGRKSP